MIHEWITFQGKEVSLNTVDHQHLSNVIWYWRLVCGQLYKEGLQELRDRFNGQILPYRPHTDFKSELEFLRYKGYLSPFDESGVAIISFQGNVIGEIRRLPDSLLEVKEETPA